MFLKTPPWLHSRFLLASYSNSLRCHTATLSVDILITMVFVSFPLICTIANLEHSRGHANNNPLSQTSKCLSNSQVHTKRGFTVSHCHLYKTAVLSEVGDQLATDCTALHCMSHTTAHATQQLIFCLSSRCRVSGCCAAPSLRRGALRHNTSACMPAMPSRRCPEDHKFRCSIAALLTGAYQLVLVLQPVSLCACAL